jgi:hypothetical protein
MKKEKPGTGNMQQAKRGLCQHLLQILKPGILAIRKHNRCTCEIPAPWSFNRPVRQRIQTFAPELQIFNRRFARGFQSFSQGFRCYR